VYWEICDVAGDFKDVKDRDDAQAGGRLQEILLGKYRQKMNGNIVRFQGGYRKHRSCSRRILIPAGA